MITTRRSLLTSFAALLAAPAIVRATSLMPVSVFTATDVFGNVEVLMDQPPRFLGLAQMKVEGGATAFDPAPFMRRYPAGEMIWVGDIVAPRSDGKVYRVTGTADSDPNVLQMGVSMTSNALQIERSDHISWRRR